MTEKEHIIIESGDAVQPFAYSVGMHGSKFFTELRDNGRFMALRCPKCKKVYIPPRGVCGDCFVEMNDWVEVGPKGVIGTFTILRFAFIDPETGAQKPVHMATALSNSTAQIPCFSTTSASRTKRRSRSVPGLNRYSQGSEGSIRDIEYFKVID